MTAISPSKVGLVLGTLLGGWHLLWVSLVALGWAQPVIDFAFRMHFLKPVYVVEPFNVGIAVILIVITAAIGYAFGYLFGALWNWFHP